MPTLWLKMIFYKICPEAQIVNLEASFQILLLAFLTAVTPITFPVLMAVIVLSSAFGLQGSSFQATLNYSGVPRVVYYLIPHTDPASQPESTNQWESSAFQFPNPPVPGSGTFPGHPSWQEDPPSYEATLNQEEVIQATPQSIQETDPARVPTVAEPLLVDNVQENNVLVDNVQENGENNNLQENILETVPPLTEDIEAAETERTVDTTAGPGQGRGAPRGRRHPARARRQRPLRP